jgi:hypothetical protein
MTGGLAAGEVLAAAYTRSEHSLAASLAPSRAGIRK